MMLACSSVPFLVTISFIVGVLLLQQHPMVQTDDRDTKVPLGERRLEAATDDAAEEETANNADVIDDYDYVYDSYYIDAVKEDPALKQCLVGTKNIYRDSIYAACNTAGAEVDDAGLGCDVYIEKPSHYCFQFYTDSFLVGDMCCACRGGGSSTPQTAPTAPNTSSSLITVPPSTSPNVLINAMEDAIAGIISSQDPLECMSSIYATDPNPNSCNYDYNETDSYFEEVCTSDAVQGRVVVPKFELYCNIGDYESSITYLRAPICVANDCETPMKCPGKPDKDWDEYFLCLFLNYDDLEYTYIDALTVTKYTIASYMNNITGIHDCTVGYDPWVREDGSWFSGGTTTSHNRMILVTVISSAVLVAMMTLLF